MSRVPARVRVEVDSRPRRGPLKKLAVIVLTAASKTTQRLLEGSERAAPGRAVERGDATRALPRHLGLSEALSSALIHELGD
eukprot:186015-Heterocapsa_arctica.AAC.1